MDSSSLPAHSPFLVIGAGPAGLTAAWAACRRGWLPFVLERGRRMGGIARTEEHRGYRFDIGGHRFFTKEPEVESLWKEMLGEQFRTTPRMSRIYYDNKYYSYPLRLPETLGNLGWRRSFAAGMSYVAARLRPARPDVTFEDWVVNRFGQRLYETFFRSYTEKVWGLPCHEIRAEWAAQRIQNLTLGIAVWQALRPAAEAASKTLIREFQYPRLGPGQMWDRFRERITAAGGRVATGWEVVSWRHEHGQVRSVVAAGPTGLREMTVDRVVSTMSLDELVQTAQPAAPAPVRMAAGGLRHRDLLLVGVVLRKPALFADNWIYVHHPGVRVGRIQNFGNWSPDLVPDPGTTSLGMEYFCRRGEDLWEMDEGELGDLASRELEALGLGRREDVLWTVVIRQPKAYPVYDDGYRERLDRIRAWLNGLGNLRPAGRNALHRYNNQDHSMMAGIAAVDRLAGGTADPWEVNLERSYHEDVVVARQEVGQVA